MAGHAYGKPVGTPAALLDVEKLDVVALLVVRLDMAADELEVETVELPDKLPLELLVAIELVVAEDETALDTLLDTELLLPEVVALEVVGSWLELDELLDDMELVVMGSEIELDMLLDELVESM